MLGACFTRDSVSHAWAGVFEATIAELPDATEDMRWEWRHAAAAAANDKGGDAPTMSDAPAQWVSRWGSSLLGGVAGGARRAGAQLQPALGADGGQGQWSEAAQLVLIIVGATSAGLLIMSYVANECGISLRLQRILAEHMWRQEVAAAQEEQRYRATYRQQQLAALEAEVRERAAAAAQDADVGEADQWAVWMDEEVSASSTASSESMPEAAASTDAADPEAVTAGQAQLQQWPRAPTPLDDSPRQQLL